jgi:hypothetical protein
MTTYRLKKIRYQVRSTIIVSDPRSDVPPSTVSLTRVPLIALQHQKNCHILLQNENGPCPLLAAANGLLLRGTLEFPAHCLQHGVASLEDVSNMLANQALATDGDSKDDEGDNNKFHMEEFLVWIPKFQHGMDVNLGFTKVDHYEYTAQLSAWDMFRIPLIHGWLVDPATAEAQVIKHFTYNVLVERIIQAQDAATELEKMENVPAELMTDDYQALNNHQAKLERLQQAATDGALMQNFLQSTSHQLTEYGLAKLREHLSNDQLAVFFRNNHFALMTKHEDQLYLLVTDLGYADSNDIVWERLDSIDGNTTLVNADFCVPASRQDDEAYSLANEFGSTAAVRPSTARNNRSTATIGRKSSRSASEFECNLIRVCRCWRTDRCSAYIPT